MRNKNCLDTGYVQKSREAKLVEKQQTAYKLSNTMFLLAWKLNSYQIFRFTAKQKPFLNYCLISKSSITDE